MTLDSALDLTALDNAVRAADEFEDDLQQASVAAAQGGIDAAKANHPYRDRTHDLTDEAHVEPVHDAQGGAVMSWPVSYAKFVDEGTSRANPYPFTPLARQVAERDLEHLTREAIAKLKSKIER